MVNRSQSISCCAGDHLVGWAASSLRWPSQLPLIDGPPGCGVVLEDPLEAGFHPHLRPSYSASNRPKQGPAAPLSASPSVQPANDTSTASKPEPPSACPQARQVLQGGKQSGESLMTPRCLALTNFIADAAIWCHAAPTRLEEGNIQAITAATSFCYFVVSEMLAGISQSLSFGRRSLLAVACQRKLL